VTLRRFALAAILAIAIVPAVQAQETWVAVATDGGSNFGYAVGMATREAAEITSLGECGGGCAIRLTALARCVAYARSDAGDASGYAPAQACRPSGRRPGTTANAASPRTPARSAPRNASSRTGLSS
jgi:Domain of unknown function (DUF4189)